VRLEDAIAFREVEVLGVVGITRWLGVSADTIQEFFWTFGLPDMTDRARPPTIPASAP
jgi:hypothetical protein